jgi:hypothetical protein
MSMFGEGVKAALKLFKKGKITPGEVAKRAEQVMKAAEKAARAAGKAR